MCSLCLCLCVCSLYGDHAFMRVMSTEKCVCVFVCVLSLWRLCFFAGHVVCEVSCVSLYGDHAFVRVMSTEK